MQLTKEQLETISLLNAFSHPHDFTLKIIKQARLPLSVRISTFDLESNQPMKIATVILAGSLQQCRSLGADTEIRELWALLNYAILENVSDHIFDDSPAADDDSFTLWGIVARLSKEILRKIPVDSNPLPSINEIARNYNGYHEGSMNPRANQ